MVAISGEGARLENARHHGRPEQFAIPFPVLLVYERPSRRAIENGGHGIFDFLEGLPVTARVTL
ncbi:hypothetical protein [Paramesorhizobium deserti]|uniref:hypothetical protein n=1 Tax=Paramesorhizobium deserti TaxID=1494590 RepID=UPI001FCDCD83|nr:hypothetical protein [Paramesorhizobium deserti]